MGPLVRAYSPTVNIRRLLALLVAIAVLFAPALTRTGAAFAAIPDHQLQMMESGHCTSSPAAADSDTSIAGQKAGGDHKSPGADKAAGKNCCISMCTAVAVSAPAADQAVPIHGSGPLFALLNQYHGRITEIATPPPRPA